MTADSTMPAGGGCTTDWRSKARAVFPELEAAMAPDWSVHVFFSELLDIVREAHRESTAQARDDLDRAYGFAKWCLDQVSRRFLADAALVSFYEHVFDDWQMRFEVAAWLPAGISHRVRPLWEWRLPADRLAEVDRLLGVAATR